MSFIAPALRPNILNQNEAGEDLSSYIKGISYDEIIMTLPAGKSKISQTTKGEAMLRAIPDLSIGKQKIGIDQESN